MGAGPRPVPMGKLSALRRRIFTLCNQLGREITSRSVRMAENGGMPELPEVESVLRQLAPRLEGRRIEAVWTDPQQRFADVERAAGHEVQALRRRGKYLLADLDGGLELILHLGMT